METVSEHQLCRGTSPSRSWLHPLNAIPFSGKAWPLSLALLMPNPSPCKCANMFSELFSSAQLSSLDEHTSCDQIVKDTSLLYRSYLNTTVLHNSENKSSVNIIPFCSTRFNVECDRRQEGVSTL